MSYSWSENPQNVQVLSILTWMLDNDVQPLLKEIEQRLAEGKNRFVIDLSQTELITSMVLGLLIQTLTRARSTGGDVVIANISPKIKQILLVTRLHTTFVVKDNLNDAVAFFEGAITV